MNPTTEQLNAPAGWLVTGAGGMLGQDVLARLAEAGERATALDRAALDLTDAAAVRRALERHRPAVVVNCAAWTAVDDAETREAEALAVNGDGPARLADACARTGAVLLHVSTDYVFAGDATAPYAEDAPTAPRSAYGRTKLAGERAVLNTLPDRGYVVRTAWLYGTGGANFVRTMIRLEGQREKLDVVDDQRGQPTWSADLAGLLLALGRGALAGTAPPGVYHGTSSGETTWYGLTREIFRLLGADPDRVHPTTSEAFVRPAPRPAYSVLGHDRFAVAGVAPLRDWRAALAEAFPRIRRVHEEDPA
ncbi:dTDP-4-dehydrorhamnose reductase [Streptomyces fungicidicus]|uniref:dTDP-4-dehydrorhamnose reductase n=1 Tax=Streptomyces fungicidicus TaxID=68203 RepID=UPI003633FE25